MSENTAREAMANSGAELFVGDVLDAPFPADNFDVITCFHVFEHLYHPREVLAKVHRWLKPGGIFYAEMPNIASVDASLFRSYWHSLELPRHLFHYSPTSLRNLLTRARLSELEMETSRSTYAEHSLRYIVDDLYSRIGVTRPSRSAEIPSQNTLWRVVRKITRLTLFAALGQLEVACGRGPDLKAVFRKQ